MATSTGSINRQMKNNMLYWIWFAIFVFIGMSLTYRDAVLDGVGNELAGIRRLIGSLGSLMFSLVLSWPVMGIYIYEWIDNLLPQGGSAIHSWTVFIVMVCLFFTFVIGLSLLGGFVGICRRKDDQVDPNNRGEI